MDGARPDYWESRKNLSYYGVAAQYARKYGHGGKLLDVGGGVGMGCRYLEMFDQFERTSVELTCSKNLRMDGVRVINSDFLAWQPDQAFDVVTCLQVIEHIPDASRFTAKIFETAPLVILSVPYQWQAGKCKHHVHDPIDEIKLYRWTWRVPTEMTIVDNRLVAVYGPQDPTG